jgi:hypothetical protein
LLFVPSMIPSVYQTSTSLARSGISPLPRIFSWAMKKFGEWGLANIRRDAPAHLLERPLDRVLEVDPVGLVRGRRGPEGGEGFSLGQYVNDRPYAASSLLAVAMSRVYKTAMSGRCEARPELAASPIPLELRIPVLPCRGGADLARRLFEPLGWDATATPIALDEAFPDWGDSRYLDLRLSGRLRLADALNHLYVLLPVLDDSKHYWVSTDEVDKLVRAGAGWLAGHPEKALITRRYLAHQSGLYRSALARLAEVDDAEPEAFDNAVPDPDQEPDGETGLIAVAAGQAATDPGLIVAVPAGLAAADAGADADADDAPVSLAEQRSGAVLAVLRAANAHRVADVGCGEGALTAALLAVMRLPRSSRPTCLRVHSRSPSGGSGSTGCRRGGGSGSA